MVSHADCAFSPNRNSLNCTVTQTDTPKSYSDPSDLPQEGAMFAQNTRISGFDFIKTIKCFTRIQAALSMFFCLCCVCVCVSVSVCFRSYCVLFQDTSDISEVKQDPL